MNKKCSIQVGMSQLTLEWKRFWCDGLLHIKDMLTLPHSHTSAPLFLSRAKEQQKEADDSGLSSKCKEDEQQFHTDSVLPCPYLSGRRHPHVSKPARVLSPVMEEEMKRNEGVAKGRNILVR